MIKFELFYKKYVEKSINLEKKEIKGKYINITKENVIIDNIIVAKVEELHSIDFMINGYTNIIEF